MNKRSLLVVAVAFAVAGPGCDKSKPQAKPAPAAPSAPAAPATAPGGVVAAPTAPSATTPPAPAGDGLKLPLVPPAVGERWSKTDDMTTNMVLDAGAKKVQIDRTQHKLDQFEIVAVDGAGVITKVKVSYPEREAHETINGKAKAKPSLLVGKSYVAWVEGGAVKATLADGAAVSAAELAELTDDLHDLGKPPVMDQIMAGRTWKIGEPYVFTADDLARLDKIRMSDKPKTTAMKLILEKVDGDVASFSMDSLLRTEGKAALEVAMQGTVNFDVRTNRPMSLSLTGPVTGTIQDMPVTGTMSGNIRYAYVAK